MPKLLVNPDTEAAWEIPLDRGKWTLGRGPENNFPIEHASVSVTHCELTVGDSSATIRDLGSTVGTFVDETLVEQCSLRPGQMIRLGEVLIRFESDFAPPNSSTPSAVVPAASRGTCKNHPKAGASFLCESCGASFCELCVTARMVKGRTARFCRTCGAECTALKNAADKLDAAQESYWRQVGGAFLYPLHRDGWILLLGGTIFLLAINFLARFSGIISLVVMLFGTGYLISYLQGILATSANGDARMPDWPDFSSFAEILSPVLQFVGTAAFSFAPVAILKLAVSPHAPWLAWAMPVCILLGCLYFPIGFAAVTVFDTLAALNPLVIISSALKMPLEYSVAVLLLAAGFLIDGLQGSVFERLLPLPFLTKIVSEFLSLYLLAVEMRLLGLLCWTKRDQLGWFGRRRPQ